MSPNRAFIAPASVAAALLSATLLAAPLRDAAAQTPPAPAAGPDSGATPAPESAGEPAPAVRTPDQWAQEIIRRIGSMSDEDLAAARAAVGEALADRPKDPALTLASALLARSEGDLKQARVLAESAVGLDPRSARAWYVRGTVAFEQARTAAMVDQMGLADTGREAMLKSIELDPKDPEPRMSLAMYYVMAPGIAGGSFRKAREQADVLLTLEGDGPYFGHTIRALVAADKEEWAEMARSYGEAERAATSPANTFNAAAAHARALLQKKNDAKAAEAEARRSESLAQTDEQRATIAATLGEALKKQKRYAEAAQSFERVIALFPEAKQSRLSLGDCLSELGRHADAAAAYEAFAARFPQDSRAEDARSKAKKQRKKAGAK